MPFYCYDDAVARGFEPFALTRPTSELRAGAALLRERWALALQDVAAGFVGAPHLAGFAEFDAPPAVVDGVLPAGSIVANARAVVPLDARADDGVVWTVHGTVAAVRLREPLPIRALADGTLDLAALVAPEARRTELGGWWLTAVWDLIGQLQQHLLADLAVLGPQVATIAHGAAVFGPHPVWIEEGATVEPHVVFDTTAGPVLVRRGAQVHAFTRVAGPCYVGFDALVASDRVSGCAIGDTCRVHGEISASILLGHANKAHDGFVGHSYLGRWVNLGAGTTTSNLKNTYGPVALWTPEGVRNTGLQFLGTLFGDHAKTGIQLPLTTGCVVGAGANVYGTMPPKHVPPFAWGGGAPYDRYDVERFVRVAERAMARRSVPLGDGMRDVLRAAHAIASARAGDAVGDAGSD